LGRIENGDSTEDSFLETWEISQLRLNADLVVLSACETGIGLIGVLVFIGIVKLKRK
jgi:CHAT domain-containing protein